MRSDGDRPALGATRTTLGVKIRDSPDILMDADGFVYPKTGGLSVAPTPSHLPLSKRPIALGGNSRLPVWRLDLDHLPGSLFCRATSGSHRAIEPAAPMRLAEFQEGIYGLQALWVLEKLG